MDAKYVMNAIFKLEFPAHVTLTRSDWESHGNSQISQFQILTLLIRN